jgi:uncharacterized protein
MERIESLDLIRGVAILGILLMNVMSMAAPTMAYYAPDWFVGAGRGENGGVMLFGMALYRRGFFSRTDAWKRALPVASVGLVGAALVLRLRYHVGTDTSAAYATMGMMMIPGLCMAVGYASLLVPIASSGSRVVRALRSAGRMAFTLYISQSVVTVALFTFVVPHLWGGVGRIALWGWVIVFSVLQVIFAHWWQATHGQGPLERLWRFLSYRRMPAS